MTTLLERQHRLADHLRFVAENSPYYRKLWQGAYGGESTPLTALPVVDLESYWSANTPHENQVLTSEHLNGPVFKSGGTTGNPKFSFYSNDDWRLLCEAFGEAFRRGGLQAGERVANLFYGGQLYASFLFFGRAVECAGVGVQYPLSGSAPVPEIIKTLQQFRIETVAGLPTTLINLLPHLAELPAGAVKLKRFLYGGEAIFPDQIDALHRFFPDCAVQSVGIAGVDYGEMGWSESNAEPGVHRCFDDSTVVEILDDEGLPVEEPGESGELVITNFRRRLMPVVRYPVGDRGVWLDEPGSPSRRFRVLGRSSSCARIGPVSLYVDDVQQVLRQFPEHTVVNFQLVVDHFEQRDRCTVRLAVANPEAVPPGTGLNLMRALELERPMISELVEKGVIHPLVIEWVLPHELVVNTRTGKTLRVLDRRVESQQ